MTPHLFNHHPLSLVCREKMYSSSGCIHNFLNCSNQLKMRKTLNPKVKLSKNSKYTWWHMNKHLTTYNQTIKCPNVHSWMLSISHPQNEWRWEWMRILFINVLCLPMVKIFLKMGFPCQGWWWTQHVLQKWNHYQWVCKILCFMKPQSLSGFIFLVFIFLVLIMFSSWSSLVLLFLVFIILCSCLTYCS